jgi:peroxiredoxin
MKRKALPPVPSRRYATRRIATWLGVTSVVVTLFAVAILGTGQRGPVGNRLASGPAPAFATRDVVSGRLVSSRGFSKQNTLLFFSEGVMCQACFEQIQSLEGVSGQLAKRELTLVNITPDSPEVLRQAADAYGIHTPLLSDESRMMSRAYDVLGLGMHSDMPGHTFILVDRRGVIRWRHDYTTMYVPPSELLKEIPALR